MSENWLRKELESTTHWFEQSSTGALRFVSNFSMSPVLTKRLTAFAGAEGKVHGRTRQ